MKICIQCGEIFSSNARFCSNDASILVERTQSSAEQFCSAERTRDSFGVAKKTEESLGPTELMSPPTTSDYTNVDITSIDIPVKGRSTFADDRNLIQTRIELHSHPLDSSSKDGDPKYYDSTKPLSPSKGMLIAGRYRLQDRIGTGAFGTVFTCHDEQKEKKVAIKLLSTKFSQDKVALLRFRREAIAVSRLHHPGIIRILDYEIGGERSYIVMDFLDGKDLSKILEEAPFMSPRRSAKLIMQCATALDAAHKEGILHRDLKPANIIIVNKNDENKEEYSQIIDFGIAKDRSSNPRLRDLTAASKVVGTPYYMSPEQARGGKLDVRADIYSLGVILYQMLTGTRPFEGESVLDILLAHAHARRVSPSTIWKHLEAEVVLDDIVLKAIMPAREDRHLSMQVFATSLKEYLSSSSKSSRKGLELKGKKDASTLPPAHTPFRQENTPTISLKKYSGNIFNKREDSSPESIRRFSEGVFQEQPDAIYTEAPNLKEQLFSPWKLAGWVSLAFLVSLSLYYLLVVRAEENDTQRSLKFQPIMQAETTTTTTKLLKDKSQ